MLSSGRSGILGLGGELAQIEVTFHSDTLANNALRNGPAPVNQDQLAAEEEAPSKPRRGAARGRGRGRRSTPPRNEHDPEAEELFGKHLNKLLSYMDVVADVFLLNDLDDGNAVFEVEGVDAGLLIGRYGDTLEAFQYLLTTLVRNELQRSLFAVLNVEGYRERRHNKINSLAREAIERALSSGRPFALTPMNANDRRKVHMQVSETAGVTSASEGVGKGRYVVVTPDPDAGGGGGEEDAELQDAEDAEFQDAEDAEEQGA